MDKPKREYMRERRQKLRAAGLCDRCGKRPPQPPSRTRCCDCREQATSGAARKRESRKSAGVCVYCGGPLDHPGARACPGCLVKIEANEAAHLPAKRARIAAASQLGLCSCCLTRLPEEGRKICRNCLDQMTACHKARREGDGT